MRLALEFHRADTYLRAYGIESTVVVFGSARVPSPESEGASDEQRRYYEEARRFGYEMSRGALHTPGCHRLVIATGGPSIPKLGATGAAYDIARRFGLKVVEPRPALVPLTLPTDEELFRDRKSTRLNSSHRT